MSRAVRTRLSRGSGGRATHLGSAARLRPASAPRAPQTPPRLPARTLWPRPQHPEDRHSGAARNLPRERHELHRTPVAGPRACPGRPRHSPSVGTRPKAAAASPASGRRSMSSTAAAAARGATSQRRDRPPRRGTSWSRAGRLRPRAARSRAAPTLHRPQGCPQLRATQR